MVIDNFFKKNNLTKRGVRRHFENPHIIINLSGVFIYFFYPKYVTNITTVIKDIKNVVLNTCQSLRKFHKYQIVEKFCHWLRITDIK